MPGNELLTADDETIRQALEFSDPMVLRGLLYQLTGDEDLARIKTTMAPGPLVDLACVAREEDVAELQEKAFRILCQYRDGVAPIPPPPSRARLHRALELTAGQAVPEEELDFWLEELALDPMPRRIHWDGAPPEALDRFHVVVIGAGLQGVNAAIQLKDAGFSFTVIEKNPGPGGTWFQNRYPGARVDIPSRVYSHTFAADYPFVHAFAPQEENEAYVNWCVDHFGVRSNIRFDTEVVAARWDEASAAWEVTVRKADGTEDRLQAHAIISAVGFLDRPWKVRFPGADSFQGTILHTSEWRWAPDVEGKRVAVIGTGASGLQLVPDLAPIANQVVVFQRTPAWIFHFPGYRDPLPPQVRWRQRNVPYYVNWERFRLAWGFGDHTLYPAWDVDPEWKDPDSLNPINAVARQRCLEHLTAKIGHDPDLVEKCLPDYPPMSKRFVVDNGWFDALLRDDVDLVTDPIEKFTERGIRTRTGRELDFDVVVLATGFHANQYLWPMRIEGRDGITPDDVWQKDGARAYLGILIPGLPNFFCLYGPNTNPKVGGPVQWGELQTRYALECLKGMIENGWSSIEVRRDAYEAFNEVLDERMSKTIWMDPRQTSYYKNEFGRSATNAPWRSSEYWRMTRRPNFRDFHVIRSTDDPKADVAVST